MAGQIQTIKLGMVNVFLVPCDEGYMLVDSGYPQTYQRLIENLSSLGITMDQIRYLFLTHHHNDHSGCVAVLRQTSNFRLITHENSLPFLENGNGSLDGALPASKGLAVFLKLLQTLMPADYQFTAVSVHKNDLIVKDDDFEILPSLGVEGKILYTPGHTNNSLSILFNNGDVLCGDICFNMPLFRLLGAGRKPIYIQNEKAVYRSWQKIYQQGGRRILPSHGTPFPIEKIIKKTNE